MSAVWCHFASHPSHALMCIVGILALGKRSSCNLITYFSTTRVFRDHCSLKKLYILRGILLVDQLRGIFQLICNNLKTFDIGLGTRAKNKIY